MGVAVAEREKGQALGKTLKSMFRALQNRPVPDRIRSIVDQLDEGDPAERKKQNRS